MPNYKAISKVIASVFYIGYIPFAPGTFGSLAAFVFVLIIKPDSFWLVTIIIICFIAGVISSHIAEKELGQKDSSKIVIDEFAGYLVSIAFLPLTFNYLISAFFLFRFFDILKPIPIRNIERHFHGGLGVMLDDIAAGIFANIILQVWRIS